MMTVDQLLGNIAALQTAAEEDGESLDDMPVKISLRVGDTEIFLDLDEVDCDEDVDGVLIFRAKVGNVS